MTPRSSFSRVGCRSFWRRGLSNQGDRHVEPVRSQGQDPPGPDLSAQQADAELVAHLRPVDPTHVLAAAAPEAHTRRVPASSGLEIRRLEQDQVHTRSNFGGRFSRKD